MVDQHIDELLAGFCRADHPNVLNALRAAYLNLHIDSQVEMEIVQHLDRRIMYLPSRCPRDGRDGD